MEKVRGKVFVAFFREIKGEATISLLIVALISSANYHLILQVANAKIFNLQRKLTHFPAPKFPPNLINVLTKYCFLYYCQNNNLLHRYEEQFRKKSAI